ncbi:putative phage abortive infection protein [Azotobacter beijerinckii]|uniref:putative phage abortive infection protein n=1 Tax=Azotobacter beijerinckii TaxID=170623 RepID=UPI002954A6FB|nr:putative phage abortive infection protein [Azotobacter beijerinckii]MDV7213538.1 putative phage abortive infection protein [Azotobacter beijerinckii]
MNFDPKESKAEGFKENDQEEKNIVSFIIALASITFVSVFASVLFHFFLGKDIPLLEAQNVGSAPYWGQIGDFCGGILNPTLSFLGLFAILKTLSLQRKAMRDTQKEANESIKEQRVQTDIYRRQSFEFSLFGFLDVHGRIVNDFEAQGTERKGRQAMKFIAEQFEESVLSKVDEETTVEWLLEHIEYFMGGYRADCAHYFRNMYQILKFIDNSTESDFTLDFDENDYETVRIKRKFRVDYYKKRQYASMLRAQLSEVEIKLLIINCLTRSGDDLKYYVEKYSILKSIRIERYFSDFTFIDDLFDSMAFEANEDINMLRLRDKVRERIRQERRARFSRKPLDGERLKQRATHRVSDEVEV